MTAPLAFAAAFPVFTEDDWRAAVAKARGRRASGAAENVEIAGVFPRRPGARAIGGRVPGAHWRIVQRVQGNDPNGIAKTVAGDAAGGASGAEISFAGGLHPVGAQLPVASARAVAAALGDVLPERFDLRIDTGGDTVVAEAFAEVAAARGERLVFVFDPIAAIAVRGHVSGLTEVASYVEKTAALFATVALEGAAVIADGRLWHAGGATEEQELAATLATFVAYLRLLPAPERVEVALAADADQFRCIAKFRAMRLLLARVAEVAGLAVAPTRIHGETAWRMMSARDPDMNILRATSAAFAAAAGGADSITVLPFDALADAPSGQGRRLARNTQIILAHEAQLFRVGDPAAGSGLIEALTAGFAEAAWKRFQTIEAAGGIVAAISAGTLLREIAQVREARIARVISGHAAMVGVNTFGRDGFVIEPASTKRMPIRTAEALVFKRVAESFEESSP